MLLRFIFAFIPNLAQVCPHRRSKLSNMLCTKLSTGGDKAVGFASFCSRLPLFQGFIEGELHVRKLLTLWIRCVENACMAPLIPSEFRVFTRISSYFRRMWITSCWSRGRQHYTGCALSYPQVWMKLCIFFESSIQIGWTGVSAGAGAGPSSMNYMVVSY